MKTTLYSMAVGEKKSYTLAEKTFESAYKKDCFLQKAQVTTLGLENDFQVDKRFHGGVDKAIHFGSVKHLNVNPSFDKLFIGCNIFVNDWDETDICVGDVYKIGEVLLQVSQPRFPCWKIGALFSKKASRYIKEHHATGWYVKVLKEGTICLSDEMHLEKRVSSLSIKKLSEYIRVLPTDQTIIDEILNAQYIAKAYKKDFLMALNSNNS